MQYVTYDHAYSRVCLSAYIYKFIIDTCVDSTMHWNNEQSHIAGELETYSCNQKTIL